MSASLKDTGKGKLLSSLVEISIVEIGEINVFSLSSALLQMSFFRTITSLSLVKELPCWQFLYCALSFTSDAEALLKLDYRKIPGYLNCPNPKTV